jgi:hypothetical protein
VYTKLLPFSIKNTIKNIPYNANTLIFALNLDLICLVLLAGCY